jgi:hypothetical protein
MMLRADCRDDGQDDSPSAVGQVTGCEFRGLTVFADGSRADRVVQVGAAPSRIQVPR